MDRYLTEEELETTEEGQLVKHIYNILKKGTEEDMLLPNCKVIEPLITNDSDILNFINDSLETDADFMFYIPVLGTEENFKNEARALTVLLEKLAEDFDDTTFENGQKLININGMSIRGKEEPNNVHNVILLMKDKQLDSNIIM